MGTNSPDPFEGEKIRPWERSWFYLKQLRVVLALTRSNNFQGRQRSLQECTRTCQAQAWCMHSSGNKGPEARGHLVRPQDMCLPWTRDPKMPRNSSRPFSSVTCRKQCLSIRDRRALSRSISPGVTGPFQELCCPRARPPPLAQPTATWLNSHPITPTPPRPPLEKDANCSEADTATATPHVIRG